MKIAKRNLIILAILMVVSSFKGYAQVDTTTNYKWGLRLDAIDLFKSDRCNAIISKQIGNYSNLRMRVGGTFKRNQTGEYYLVYRSDFYVAPGIEWQYRKNRLQIYHGFEIALGYEKFRQDVSKIPNSDDLEDYINTTFSVSPSYFIGFKYRLTDQLFLWSESSLVLTHEMSRTNRYQPSRLFYHVNNTTASFNPVRFFGIMFTF